MTREEYLHHPATFAKRGTDLPQARLDASSVREIRREYGPKTARQLASQHGVSKRCIERVVAWETWIHV